MMSDTTERPNEPDRKALAAIPGRWAQPEPATLATLPKGGAQLSYMGHAEVTLALIEAGYPATTAMHAANAPVDKTD